MVGYKNRRETEVGFKKSTEWGVISSSWGLRQDTRQGGEIYVNGKSNSLIALDRLGIGGTQKPGSIDPGLPACPGRLVPAARASEAFCADTPPPCVSYPKGLRPSHRAEPARRPEGQGAEPVRRPGSGPSGIQARWTQQDADQDPKPRPTGWREPGQQAQHACFLHMPGLRFIPEQKRSRNALETAQRHRRSGKPTCSGSHFLATAATEGQRPMRNRGVGGRASEPCEWAGSLLQLYLSLLR